MLPVDKKPSTGFDETTFRFLHTIRAPEKSGLAHTSTKKNYFYAEFKCEFKHVQILSKIAVINFTNGLNTICWHGFGHRSSGKITSRQNIQSMRIHLSNPSNIDNNGNFVFQERLTSHGGGIGLASGSPAYSGGGRASSNQHGHGPASHQPADFQPPYFPPPFHHPSTHQSPPQQQQQVSKDNKKCRTLHAHSSLLSKEPPRSRLFESCKRSIRPNAALFRSASSHNVSSSSLQSVGWP